MISRIAAVLLLCATPTFAAAQVTSVVTKTDGVGNVTETDTTTTAGPASTQAAVTLGTSIIPGSGLTPSTALSSGAGTQESTLLEAVAVHEAAARLVRNLGDQHGVVLVAASTQSPDASAWRAFTYQTGLLKDSLDLDAADLAQLDETLKNHHIALLDRRAKPPKRQDRFSFLPALAIAVPVAQKILSYATQNLASGGVALTADDYLTEVAVADLKPDWQILGQNAGMNDKPVNDQLHTLHDGIAKVRAGLRQAHADLDPNDKDGAAALAVSDTAVNADIKAVTDYMSSIQAPASMPLILQSQLYAAALEDPKAGVLYLKMHAASGGLFTRTTFWSNLGFGMPIANSIDVKISYVFYVQGQARKSGVFDVTTKNLRTDKVLDFVKAYDHGDCAGQIKDADLRNSCPVVIGLH